MGTVVWQWINQSVNVAVNYSNANKSSPLTTSQIAVSYAVAVSGSCGVALGLNAVLPRLKNLSEGTRTTLGRLVPFAAVASANVLNVFLMRGHEITHGIDIYDDNGKSLGRSKDAAFNAVGQVCLMFLRLCRSNIRRPLSAE